MQFESPRHNNILTRMHTGAPLGDAYRRVRDLNLVSLASTISARCPHALVYATATDGVEFVRSVGERVSRSSERAVDFEHRVIEAACRVAHDRSTAHGALFDFDRWALGLAERPALVGRHESPSEALEVLGSHEFPAEVLSFVRFIRRFMSPGTPLELLADDAPRDRKQCLRATRTTAGVEILEIHA